MIRQSIFNSGLDMAQKKKTTRQPSRKTASSKLPLDENTVMKGGMPQALGMRVISLPTKKVTGEMAVTPMHLILIGRVNGGGIISFADALGAVGAVAPRPAGFRGGTIESKSNCFAPGV